VTGPEPPRPGGHVYLSDLPWTYATNGFGPPELDSTNGETAPLDGAPIRLRGAAYDKGLGVHGPSLLRYRLGRACSRFIADVGIDDDQNGQGSVSFEVWADGERLFESGRVTGSSPPRTVSVDVSGKRDLRLFVGVGGDTFAFDHAVWAAARLECAPAGPSP
jgi:alpha-galactosidase